MNQRLYLSENIFVYALVCMCLVSLFVLGIYHMGLISVIAFIGLLFSIYSLNKPEIPLAILFNGTIIYFYLMYKLKMETSTLLTGGFYFLLALIYGFGGIMALIPRPKVKVHVIDILVALFALVVLVSYLVIPAAGPSKAVKASYAPLLVLGPYLGIRCLNSLGRIERFIKYVALIPILLIIPSLIELVKSPSLAGGRFSLYMFLDKGDNPILLGITYGFLSIILLVWIFEKNFDIKSLAILIVSVYLMLRSGSRGAIISFILSIIFYIFIIERTGMKRKLYILLLLSGLIGGGIFFLPEVVRDFLGYTITPEARLSEFSSVYMRLSMWKVALSEFIEHPLTGVGFGNSAGGSGFPHNIILEVASEFGLPGLLLFFSICYATVASAMKGLKKVKNGSASNLMKISLLLFVFSLTEAMFSGYISNQTNLFMSLGLIASTLVATDLNPICS